MQLTDGGTGVGIQTQTFNYDVRGNQIGSVLTDGLGETREYDADGRLLWDDYFYAAHTEVALDPTTERPSEMDIGGWLQSATINSYNAEGQLVATSHYGRDQEDWDRDWERINNDGTLTGPEEEDLGTTGYGLIHLQTQVFVPSDV